MGDVLVKGGSISGERIATLDVDLHNLPKRSIDRETALRWLRDGHSLIPVIAGKRQPALQLVEVADGEWSIRTDNLPVAQDSLPF
jgi:hypothetical protein